MTFRPSDNFGIDETAGPRRAGGTFTTSRRKIDCNSRGHTPNMQLVKKMETRGVLPELHSRTFGQNSIQNGLDYVEGEPEGQ